MPERLYSVGAGSETDRRLREPDECHEGLGQLCRVATLLSTMLFQAANDFLGLFSIAANGGSVAGSGHSTGIRYVLNRPRRPMAFELRKRKHIEDQLAKIVRQELGQAARTLTATTGTGFETAVHESRKSVKKARGRGVP